MPTYEGGNCPKQCDADVQARTQRDVSALGKQRVSERSREELRKLDSVEVVSDELADNELQVVGVMTGSGVYSVAVLLVSKADVESPLFFNDNPECYPTEALRKDNEEAHESCVVVDDLWVFTDRDVQSLATRIAAAVDVNDVELHRQTHRRLEEMRRKRADSKEP